MEHRAPLPTLLSQGGSRAFAVDVGPPDRAKEIYDVLVARGVTVTEEIDDKPWGIRRFGVVDPNGVRVTILCHLPEGT